MLKGSRQSTLFPKAHENHFFPRPISSFTHAPSSTTQDPSTSQLFIEKIFQGYQLSQSPLTFDVQMKIDLLKDIVMTEVEKALRRRHQPSALFQMIESLPKDLSLKQRLDVFCDHCINHPAIPVITAHPTRVFSNPVLFRLYDITHTALELELIPLNQKLLEEKLRLIIEDLLKESLLPAQNLTPEEEAKTAIFIYHNMMDTFPGMLKETVHYFISIHGGTYSEIEQGIKTALIPSFQNIHSWVRGDADGNHQVTAETMASTLPTRQMAIIKRHLKRINSLMSQCSEKKLTQALSQIHDASAYLHDKLNKIRIGICFDLPCSDEAKAYLIPILRKLSELTIDFPTIQDEIVCLHELIELEGFFGGMKEFVRQTTKVNEEVLDNLIDNLANVDEDSALFLKESQGLRRAYHDLSWEEKTTLLQRINTKSELFLALKSQSQHFNPASVKELNRLSFVMKHNNIFTSYISSDTEHEINANEMLLLMHFAAYLDGSLRMSHLNNYPVNTLLLCETPKDLSNFKQMFTRILSDSQKRKKIQDSGFIEYVSGPSDLGKVGGIMVYSLMLQNQMDVEDILIDLKTQYPELSSVQLRVLNGFGGDMKRRFGSAQLQHYATFQGWAAYDILGAPGAYIWYLNNVVGYPSENYFKIMELRLLKEQHPEAFTTFFKINQTAVTWFEAFISRPDTLALLGRLTDFNLEKRMNISSRAGAKKITHDPTKVRAIGLVNLYLLAGINWDIFMSVAGLVDLPESEKSFLPLLFDRLTVLKDIVYKLIFSIAVSDFSRAWRAITTKDQDLPTAAEKQRWLSAYHDPSIEHKEFCHSLAFIEDAAFKVLKSLSDYLPELQQRRAQAYWSDNPLGSKPSHESALGLMDAVGADFKRLATETRDLIPKFQRLARCIDEYQARPGAITEENAVLACRGYQLAEGPRMIYELLSPLHLQAITEPTFARDKYKHEPPALVLSRSGAC